MPAKMKNTRLTPPALQSVFSRTINLVRRLQRVLMRRKGTTTATTHPHATIHPSAHFAKQHTNKHTDHASTDRSAPANPKQYHPKAETIISGNNPTISRQQRATDRAESFIDRCLTLSVSRNAGIARTRAPGALTEMIRNRSPSMRFFHSSGTSAAQSSVQRSKHP